MGRLSLSGVSWNHLERLREGVILTSWLLVPLRLRCRIRCLGLDTRRRRGGGSLSFCTHVNRGDSGVDLCKPRVGNSGVRFGLGRSWLRLRNLIDPSFLCGKRSLLKRRLFDLGV